MIKWFWDSGLWIICIVFAVIGLLFYGIHTTATNQAKVAQAWRDWSHKCIEAGGVPATVNSYVKGIGEGEMCVKIAEKVEVDIK